MTALRPLLLGLAIGCSPSTEQTTVTVFSAASTTEALTEVLAELTAMGGPATTPVLAASSTLARQIEHGAPADLFLSADTQWMDHLEAQGKVSAAHRVNLLGNALVVVAPLGTQLGADIPLLDALDGGRLAVADPSHVPAGRYARAALERTGEWAPLEPHVAPAAHVRAALALVEQGACPLGVVYQSDAAESDNVEVVRTLPVVSPAIVYPLALVGSAPTPAATEVFSHLQDAHSLSIFASHGFEAP